MDGSKDRWIRRKSQNYNTFHWFSLKGALVVVGLLVYREDQHVITDNNI